ncbi:MAG TPA: hypothetical protein VFN67_41135 [Polyangiales bacterium]|nr:hypothetical protein [Polyangiales bacterium]
MAKNVLFLVHGMGWHLESSAGAGAWHLDVERALQDAWALFPSLAARSFETYIELAPLNYDGVFRDYLQGVSDSAERVHQALGDAEYAKVAAVIAGADAAEQNFFWANAADVLLYRFGGDLFRNVHAKLGQQIAQRVLKAWDSPSGSSTLFSVMCHSLGTATVHGALNRLGGGRIAGSDALRMGGNFGLHAYVSLANVSRLLFRGQGSLYERTIVRPQLSGGRYVRRFLNVRHIADPIPAPLCFAPKSWGPGFTDIAVRHLRDPNVHGFTHYLANPRVSGALFRTLLPAPLLSQAEVDAVAAEYRDVDVEPEAKRQQVEQLVDDISKSLKDAYAEDNSLVYGTAEFAAKLLRAAWRNRQRLGAALGVLT